MLTRQGPPEGDRKAENITYRFMPARNLIRILRIHKDVHVYISISCVPEVDDLDIQARRDPLYPVDKIGDPHARDGNVLVDLHPPDLHDSGRDGPARLPHGVPLRLVTGPEDHPRPQLAAHILQDLPFPLD